MKKPIVFTLSIAGGLARPETGMNVERPKNECADQYSEHQDFKPKCQGRLLGVFVFRKGVHELIIGKGT
jgi:hypothetical protein